MAALKVLVLCLLVCPLVFAEEEYIPCAPKSLCVPPHYQQKQSLCDDEGAVGCIRVETTQRSCGQGSPENTERLLGGEYTNPMEIPWMVSIKRRVSDTQQWTIIGSGALIHSGAVLTAAHVVNGVSASDLQVEVAAYDLKESLHPHQVAAVLMHPRFSPTLLLNDVALLVFIEPVQNQDSIMPICLPDPGRSFDKTTCIFSAWNQPPINEITKGDTLLKKVSMHVIPKEVCQNYLRLSTTFKPWIHMSSGFMCAIGNTNANERPYQHDGGGPLFCEISPKSNNFYLAGIASFGSPLSERAVPVVFSYIPFYRNWIDDKLGRLNDGFVAYRV